jgi:hypothetical protein
MQLWIKGFFFLSGFSQREICEYALKKGGGGESLQFEVLLVLDGTPEPPDLAIWSDRIVRVSEAVMCKVAGVESSQGLGCVGVLPLPSSFCNLEAIQSASSGAFNWCPSPRRVLVLDGIQVKTPSFLLCVNSAAFVTVMESPCMHSLFLSLTSMYYDGMVKHLPIMVGKVPGKPVRAS